MTRARLARPAVLIGLTTALVGALLATPATARPIIPPTTPTAGPLNSARAQHPSTALIVHVGSGRDTLRSAVQRARATGTVTHTFGRQQAFAVRVPAADAAAATARLEAVPGVSRVEKPVTRRFFDVPNDPKYAREATYLDAVHAPQAWSTTHGSPEVTIAVVDSGIDVGHPDLIGKIADTYNANNGSKNITDDVGHGTFVAGVAAASTNNGIGVAGAGYDTRLLGVKIALPSGELSLDDEVAGVRWAADRGADVINLSLGGIDPSAAESDAIAYAQSKGALVVAAAGNDSSSTKQYPAAYPGVVVVGATDPARHSAAGFSNYGSWVTLAAPGVDFYSTAPRAGSQSFTSSYATNSGTSFSTPLVAGLAALVKARNRSLTVPQLRRILIVSSHGYSNRGLGAGQVDFQTALQHVPPASRPASPAASGTADRIRFTAVSAAVRVAFRVDSGPLLPGASVSGGTATVSYPSWGLANGSHTLQAFDCTAFDECGSGPSSAVFPVHNTAPTVSSPATNSLASGRFTVTASHPSGGGARLEVDGTVTGFDATTPFSFPVNGSTLTDGTHTLRVVGCGATPAQCAGPASADRTLRTDSAHPRITGLAPVFVSPNGDHVQDTSTLRFTLDRPGTVTVKIFDADDVLVRSVDLGPLSAGAHAWTWRARTAAGAALPDGVYQIAIDTVRFVSSFPERGFASARVTIDTSAPGITGITGAASFYPYPDGYRDAFRPYSTLHEPGTVRLTIRSVGGRVVRTIGVHRARGVAAINWDGRDTAGKRVAGGFSWSFTVTDAAGNSRHTPARALSVSSKRLVAVTAYSTRHGNGYTSVTSTSPPCTRVGRRESSFRRGVRLVNGCSPGGYELVYADYVFSAPKAFRYLSLAFQVYGHSQNRPSELLVAVHTGAGDLEVPGYRTIDRRGDRWTTLGSVTPAGHLGRGRSVSAEIVLDSRYRPRNDYDVKYARMQIRYLALR